MKRLFIRYLIFASTDNDEKTTNVYKKNVGEYLEIVKTAYDDYEKFMCIQDETRKRSLDKAEKIAEQFLDEREKRHEDREKEVDLKKREKMKEDWEEKVEWTVPEAATAVLLRQWLFKGAYLVFGVLFSVVLIYPVCPCVFSSSWACLVSLWVVRAFLVVSLLCIPFHILIGDKKKPSLLKYLPVCWHVIIDIEQKYELEHKQQEKDINKRNIHKDVKKEDKKEIKECMKNHKRQFR